MKYLRVAPGIAVVTAAVLAACGGGGGGGNNPPPVSATSAPVGTPTPSSAPTKTPTPSNAPSATPAPSPTATVAPTPTPTPTSAGTPTPLPTPVQGSALIVTSANSAFGGSLALVAPDGQTFVPGTRDLVNPNLGTGGPDSGYSFASYQVNGTPTTPPAAIAAAGAGLMTTTTTPADAIPGVPIPAGGVDVFASTTAAPGTIGGAGTGTIAIPGVVSINAYVYPRFALGCGAALSSSEFPPGITFNADGSASPAATPAQADLFISGPDCAAPFNVVYNSGVGSGNDDALVFPNYGIDSLHTSGATLAPFPLLRTNVWSQIVNYELYTQLVRSTPLSGTTVGPALEFVIKTGSGRYVKLMLTYYHTDLSTNNHYLSGAYMVSNAPPGDGF